MGRPAMISLEEATPLPLGHGEELLSPRQAAVLLYPSDRRPGEQAVRDLVRKGAKVRGVRARVYLRGICGPAGVMFRRADVVDFRQRLTRAWMQSTEAPGAAVRPAKDSPARARGKARRGTGDRASGTGGGSGGVVGRIVPKGYPEVREVQAKAMGGAAAKAARELKAVATAAGGGDGAATGMEPGRGAIGQASPRQSPSAG